MRRFITGAAGRGKSYLKKALIRVLRSAGLRVRVFAVAALVAQDDGGSGGSTIASAFNMRGVSPSKFDEKAYELSKVDVAIVDEISFASIRDARAMEYYLARGQYLRKGSVRDSVEERQPRHLCYLQHCKNASDPWSGTNIIFIGDFMQLRTSGGEPLFASERLWGSQFRQNTLFLEECVRSSDAPLMKLCELCRDFSFQTLDVCSKEIAVTVRDRAVRGMKDVPLGTTILSPRFERAVQFCEYGLVEIGERSSESALKGWGNMVYQIPAQDYVIGNRNIRLEQCQGMDNAETLEGKKRALDKDHTRLRVFTFRLGMIAVITENEKISASGESDIAWWDDLIGSGQNDALGENEDRGAQIENVRRAKKKKHRLLNGERVRIVGVVHGKRALAHEVIGVRVQSEFGRWDGTRTIGMSRSGGEGLKKPSVSEQLAIRYSEFGCSKRGRVARRQVPLMLELALTVHKAQGCTLEKAVIDLGCTADAYSGGLFYTAITRVRCLSDLYFIDVPESDVELLRRVRSCKETREEMKRCEEKSESLKIRSEKIWNDFKNFRI